MRFASTLPLAAALALCCAPAPAAAQRTLAQDTLSGDTPVALTCGFCATERFGAVFRELPAPARGLESGDFPIVVDAIRLAMADASVVGSGASLTCEGATGGGTALVDIEVWTGETPPTGNIRDEPLVDWPGETLVWATVDAPVELSVAESDGSARYGVMFNRFLIEDEGGMPVRIEPPNTYLRVVVTMNAGAISSAVCDGASLDPPGGFPMRDDDGRIADERSFIYAAGTGWLWNEEAGIDGDWGVRVDITAEGSPAGDGGAGDVDAGAAIDAGAVTDAGAAADAGGTEDAGGPPPGDGDDGCGCSVPGGGEPGGPLALALVAVMAVWVRRRR